MTKIKIDEKANFIAVVLKTRNRFSFVPFFHPEECGIGPKFYFETRLMSKKKNEVYVSAILPVKGFVGIDSLRKPKKS